MLNARAGNMLRKGQPLWCEEKGGGVSFGPEMEIKELVVEGMWTVHCCQGITMSANTELSRQAPHTPDADQGLGFADQGLGFADQGLGFADQG